MKWLVLGVLGLALQAVHAASPIAGGWHYGTGVYPDRFGFVVTLFDDGTYYIAENESIDDPSGMERGTYLWNQEAETIAFTELEDTGNVFFLTTGTYSAELADDTLTLGLGPFRLPLQRVIDPSLAIVGSWYTGPTAAPRDDGVVITFLKPVGSNPGHYVMAEDGVADEEGGPGMELGDYLWDGASTLTIPRVWVDTTGDWGLSDAVVSAVVVDGDRMIVTIPDEGDIELARVPTAAPAAAVSVPIPAPWLVVAALLLGAVGTVRSASHATLRRCRGRASPTGSC